MRREYIRIYIRLYAALYYSPGGVIIFTFALDPLRLAANSSKCRPRYSGDSDCSTGRSPCRASQTRRILLKIPESALSDDSVTLFSSLFTRRFVRRAPLLSLSSARFSSASRVCEHGKRLGHGPATVFGWPRSSSQRRAARRNGCALEPASTLDASGDPQISCTSCSVYARSIHVRSCTCAAAGTAKLNTAVRKVYLERNRRLHFLFLFFFF